MSTVTSRDGTTIDYDRYGRGPAVIFIGGASQHRAIDPNTTDMARLVAEGGFSAVDYDRRGRDRSGDTAPWSVEREAEDVAALIEAVGGPATLYTSSSGATVALAAAVAGVALSRLALYEPPFFAGVDYSAHLEQLRSLIADDDNDAAMRYYMGTVIGVPAGVVDGMTGEPSWPRLASVAPTLPYDLGAVNDIDLDPDWGKRWAAVTVPTMVYSGDQTFPGLPECADAVTAALPNAHRRIIPGQGHGPAADVMAPILLEFLRSG